LESTLFCSEKPKTYDFFMSFCIEKLNHHFHIPQFRPAQKDVLQLLYENSHILATLPTGAGKTLLYAIPALYLEGMTVVICPLISLMRDQERRMMEAGIPSAMLTSEQTIEERKAVYSKVVRGIVKILFVSPERFVLPSFIQIVSRTKVSMCVVDEAHCVVTWGVGFRPEYAKLSETIEKFKPQKIMALTATAGQSSRKFIAQKVFPENTDFKVYVSSPIQPHIKVECRRCTSEDEKWNQFLSLLSQNKENKTICYFPRRDLCEDTAIKLRKKGFCSVVYHAGLSKEAKKHAENYILKNPQVVVCATQAFGMGVDIPSVTMVLVYGFPGNIEEFFQMIGRAGRQGEASRGILIWNGSDPKKREYQFNITFPDYNKAMQLIQNSKSIYPGVDHQTIIEEKQILDCFSSKTCEIDFQGLQTILRLTGHMQNLAFGETYLRIKFIHQNSIYHLIKDLPATPTKRSLFFQSILYLTNENLRMAQDISLIVPLSILTEETQMNKTTIVEILNHYYIQQKLVYHIYEGNLSRQYLLSGSAQEILRHIQKYTHIRQNFEESLKHLSVLAHATTCRLKRSESFFLEKSRIKSCKQCDLCLP